MRDVELVAFLICDALSRQANGKTVVTGVFDRIWASKVPAVHSSMTAYFRLQADPDATSPLEMRLVFVSPSGIRQESPPLPVSVNRQTGIVEGSIDMPNFPLPEFGSYRFELTVQGKHVASYTVWVVKTVPTSKNVH